MANTGAVSRGRDITNDPTPKDFDKFLPWACLQLSVETDVIITREHQKSYASQDRINEKKSKSRKLTVKSSTDTDGETESSETKFSGLFDRSNCVMLETIYDHGENLVKLKFHNNKVIPRQIFKLIALIIPYHKHLTSIDINRGLHMESIYEISQFLPVSQITEICLDGTFLEAANYHILLMGSNLKHLSLAKCKLNDAVVQTIASKLEYPWPASKILSVLNLSTNKITDSGVKYLANALRTNRQLSYLNLADNLITDVGGISILDILQKFVLTESELLTSRARYVSYLKNKIDFVTTLTKQLRMSVDHEKKPKKKVRSATNLMTKKNKTLEKDLSVPLFRVTPYTDAARAAQKISERAHAMAEIKLGQFTDPFSPMNTENEDDVVYCLGNNSLCYLNLAYNDLSYASVKKLHEVLLTQKHLNRTPKGLINVMIDGNFIPVACKELKQINDLIRLGLSNVKQIPEVKKRSSARAIHK